MNVQQRCVQAYRELVAQATKDGFDVPGAKLSQGYRLDIKQPSP